MRYLILLCSFSALYMIVMEQMAPEKTDSAMYYAGFACCALIALAITWNDKSDDLIGFIGAVITVLTPLAGIALVVYGAGSKLGYFSDGTEDEVLVSTTFEQLPTLCLITGIAMILMTVFRIWLNRTHKD